MNLRWTEIPACPKKQRPRSWIAHSPFGMFVVVFQAGRFGWYITYCQGCAGYIPDTYWYETLGMAQAVCQAHFDDRVKTVLGMAARDNPRIRRKLLCRKFQVT